MQIAKTFDPQTINKIKSSALIGLVGFLVAVIPMVQQDVLAAVQDKPYLVALLTALGSWGYNALKEYLTGHEEPTPQP